MPEPAGLSPEDIAAESATALPNKEVMSLLDLNADVDLALDLAAPIDLAVAANLNVAAPINAAASANVLSFGSESAALADQGVSLTQHNSGEAIANAPQTSTIDQGNDVVDPAAPAPVETPDDGGSVNVPVPGIPGVPAAPGGLLDGNLLDVNVDIDADIDAAAPVAGAVAANANVAAPINASVAANIAGIDSSATAVAQQTAIINQDLDGAVAEATADQDSEITQ